MCTIRNLILAAICIFLAACSKDEQKTIKPEEIKNNFILISIDTTRADSIGAYGNQVVRTPAIDSVAREGILFQQTVSHVPLTLPSHATMLTGMLPAKHGVHDNNGYTLNADATTLAEMFRNHGYKTAGFVSSIVLDHRFGLDQGFDFYDDHIQYGSTETENRQNERIAEETANSAITWVSNNLNSPFFLFIHFYDPHAKYSPPEPYASQMQDRYLGEISYVDSQVQRLLSAIQPKKQHTYIVITSDHGEGLGEHGELGHGLFLYDSTIKVPLIIAGPELPKGKQISTQVRLSDLAPTLADFANIPIPSVDGRSLKALIQGGAWQEAQAVMETEYPLQIGWSALAAARTSQWKMIDAPAPELYDLKNDPEEKINVYSDRKAVAYEIKSRISKYKVESQAGQVKKTERDPELEEQLRSLGYLSGSPKPKDLSNLPDPKSKIEVWKLYEQATFAAMDSDKSTAIDSLKKAIALDNTNAVLFDTLAQFQVDNDVEEAIRNWKRALTINPEDARIHHRLALGFKKIGDTASSLQEEQLALKIDPKMPEALLGLGNLLMETGRPSEAIGMFEKLLEIDPRNAPAAFQLGNAFQRLGDLSQAAVSFEKAITFNPALPYPYYGLAIVKGQTGDYQSAEDLLKKALQIDPNFSEAYFNLAVIYERTARNQDALSAYEQFIQTADPKIHAARIETARQKLRAN